MADSQRKSYNLFDYTKQDTANGYVDNAFINMYGATTTENVYAVSEYIEITGQYVSLSVPISLNAPAVCFYDSEKHFISGAMYSLRSAVTEQIPQNAVYIRFTIVKQYASTTMVNLGNTLQPYAPYWQHSLRKLTTATEAVENPLYSDGTAITSYTIKGNTVQNGTPTPSNPVEVNGTGDRTGNLYNSAAQNTQNGFKDGYRLNQGSEDVSADNSITEYIPISAETKYTLKLKSSAGWTSSIAYYDSSKNRLSYTNYENRTTISITTPQNSAYMRFTTIVSSSADYGEDMLVEGETAPTSYIPYGYKIPIPNGQQTTNIYLGSTQTTRPIRKLVFTGNEGWVKSSSSNPDDYLYHLDISEANQGAISDSYCTHEPYSIQYPTGNTQGFTFKNFQTGFRLIYINVGADIMNAQPSGNTINGFKEYLAAQYAAGTPVTVWYVLATPETAAVNEPLMKIGTYADTLSNATAIPTTEGANSITVDTTVQPSEFTATWTGWHNAEVKEKSENLFDKSTAMQGKMYDENGVLVDAESNWYATDYIPVTGGETYIRSIAGGGVGNAYNEYDSQKNFIGRYTKGYGYPITVGENTAYITFSINTSTTALDNYMLNTGSTALPYEPYWK